DRLIRVLNLLHDLNADRKILEHVADNSLAGHLLIVCDPGPTVLGLAPVPALVDLALGHELEVIPAILELGHAVGADELPSVAQRRLMPELGIKAVFVVKFILVIYGVSIDALNVAAPAGQVDHAAVADYELSFFAVGNDIGLSQDVGLQAQLCALHNGSQE